MSHCMRSLVFRYFSPACQDSFAKRDCSSRFAGRLRILLKSLMANLWQFQ